MERVYIGLGSNLAEPRQQLEAALASLAELPASVGRLQPGDPAIPTIFLED